MDNIQISLASNSSKISKNSSLGINVNLVGKKRNYVDTNIVGTINAFDRYNTERARCNKIRLTCPVNSVCSNILFNPVTEIVKNEGADGTIVLNYTPMQNGEITDVKNSEKHPIKPLKNNDNFGFEWTAYEAIRDTQLSSNDFGYDYHCGIDFFNNHLLRTDTFKIVSYNSINSKEPQNRNALNENKGHVYIDENFNTLDDWMRDSEGNIVLNHFWDPLTAGNLITYYYEVGKLRTERESSKLFRSNRDTYKGDFTIKIHLRKDTEQLKNIIDTQTKIHLSLMFAINIPSIHLTLYTNFHGDLHFDGKNFGIDSEYDMIQGVINVNVKLKNMVGNANGETPEIDSMVIISSDEFTSGFKWIYVPKDIILDNVLSASHLYQTYDVNSFDYTILNKLIEENGWFGFKNTSRLPTYDTAKGEILDISKPINSKIGGNFIDMYPTRDLYSFKPKYNSSKRRIEKNWDYCITYPYSSTTENIPFIDKASQGLKILMFDEFLYNDSQTEVITFYCVSQHGLKAGDYVNIYATVNETAKLMIENAEVSDVYNKYIFQIYKNGVTLSNYWYDVSIEKEYPKQFTAKVNNKDYTYEFDFFRKDSYTLNNNRYYILPDSKKINLSDDVLNLSFKKVVNNMECSYYVRLFSKLPNFKFSSDDINQRAIYDNNLELIKKYRKNAYTFENHINSLGFANNIYGDSISEIVFTDDIDLSYLHDNLGRPLSEIYLTIIKRNKGYKDWYGVNKQECNISNSDIEFSHCFGKNTCGFLLSDESINESSFSDVRKLGKYGYDGLNMQAINSDNIKQFEANDEIDIDSCDCFYGDLCCYSPAEVLETTIQPVMDRFNTAQRELTPFDASYSAFSKIYYDEVINDEETVGYTDSYNYKHSLKQYYDAYPRKEGYYYQMHYNIPIRAISSDISQQNALRYELSSFIVVNASKGIYRLCTKEENGFVLNDKIVLYDLQENKAYRCAIDKIITTRKFECAIYSNDTDFSQISDLSNFIVLTKDETIPSYAELLLDGSLSYCWRNVSNDNASDNANIEAYPFTNGAFYINRPINLFLRRQDPHDYFGTHVVVAENTNNIAYEPEGEYLPEIKEDNYVEKKNMKDCASISLSSLLPKHLNIKL